MYITQLMVILDFLSEEIEAEKKAYEDAKKKSSKKGRK